MTRTIFLLSILILLALSPACKKTEAPQDTPIPESTAHPSPAQPAPPQDTAQNKENKPAETAPETPKPIKKDIRLTTSCTPSHSIESLDSTYDHEDGTYSLRSFVDGYVSYHVERLHKIERDDPSILVDMIKNTVKFEPRDFQIDVDQALTDRLKSKTYKITYLAGHNEDTASHIDYYILGEDFDYSLRIACGIDFVEDIGQPIIDELVKNLKFETKE